MPISPKTQKTAQDFMTAINKILYVVEELSNTIPEGAYLEMMDALGKIHQFKPDEAPTLTAYLSQVVQEVRDNPTVRRLDRQAINQWRERQGIKDDATILKYGGSICPLCDMIVMRLKPHQHTKKCRDIATSKGLVKSTGVLNNIQLKKGIVILKAYRLSKIVKAEEAEKLKQQQIAYYNQFDMATRRKKLIIEEEDWSDKVILSGGVIMDETYNELSLLYWWYSYAEITELKRFLKSNEDEMMSVYKLKEGEIENSLYNPETELIIYIGSRFSTDALPSRVIKVWVEKNTEIATWITNQEYLNGRVALGDQSDDNHSDPDSDHTYTYTGVAESISDTESVFAEGRPVVGADRSGDDDTEYDLREAYYAEFNSIELRQKLQREAEDWSDKVIPCGGYITDSMEIFDGWYSYDEQKKFKDEIDITGSMEVVVYKLKEGITEQELSPTEIVIYLSVEVDDGLTRVIRVEYNTSSPIAMEMCSVDIRYDDDDDEASQPE